VFIFLIGPDFKNLNDRLLDDSDPFVHAGMRIIPRISDTAPEKFFRSARMASFTGSLMSFAEFEMRDCALPAILLPGGEINERTQ
jgi:hypothetical protein